MALPLPTFALTEEGDLAVEFQPGLIDAEKTLPFGMAFGGRHFGLFVDDVLEVVDHRAVGDEGQRARQMAVHELLCVGTEKAIRVPPAEELHAHRVHFAGFRRRSRIFRRDPLAVHPVGKGMARLVGDDFDVALCPVEVREDERTLIQHEIGLISAAFLALGGENVHQFLVQHRAEELAGFRRQFVVELLALFQDVLRRSDGLRVAAAEAEGRVRE